MDEKKRLDWKIKAVRLQADIMFLDPATELIETQDEFGGLIRVVQPRIITTYENFTLEGYDEKYLKSHTYEKHISIYDDWYMTYHIKMKIIVTGKQIGRAHV